MRPDVHLVLTAADLTEGRGFFFFFFLEKEKKRGCGVFFRRSRRAAPGLPRPSVRSWRRGGCGSLATRSPSVVADSLTAARDAAELIVLDIDARPAKTEPPSRRGARTGPPRQAPDRTIAYDFDMGGDAEGGPKPRGMAGAARAPCHQPIRATTKPHHRRQHWRPAQAPATRETDGRPPAPRLQTGQGAHGGPPEGRSG